MAKSDSERLDDLEILAAHQAQLIDDLNEVVLEQQLLALNETTMQHQLSLRLMDRHLNMVRTALGRGQ